MIGAAARGRGASSRGVRNHTQRLVTQQPNRAVAYDGGTMSERPKPEAGEAEQPDQPPPPDMAHPSSHQSRTQRRVERTRTLIEDAFVALAAERGVDKVGVEDIAAHADIAKATFYAHYANKEALQAAVFARLAEELASRIAYRDGPWTQVRRSAVTASFEHVHDMRDLYRAC